MISEMIINDYPFEYRKETMDKSLEALIKIKELSLIERHFVYHCWTAYKEYEEEQTA